MSSKYLNPEDLKCIEDLKSKAEILLKDQKAFDEEFEKVFKTFDKNKDNTIGESEYSQFFNLLLNADGKINITRIMTYFERADKDKNGSIDKQEFKKEVKKRLDQFVENKKFQAKKK